MPKSLSWDELRTFLAVCERGSVGAAARWLGVNHSTVLRHVGDLEAALGHRLFDRLPSGYALTTEGQELAESLAGVAEQIESAQRRLDGGTTEVRGVVRLTTTDTLAYGLLMPHVAEFRRHHPAVEVQLVIDDAPLNLTQREADVAIRGTARPPENLVAWKLGVVRTAMYASRTYLERLGPDATVADHVWVAADEALAYLDSAKWLREHVAPERVGVRCDSLFGIATAVTAGLGVGLVQCPYADAHPELVRLGGPYPELDTPTWLLAHPDLKQVRRIRAFIDHMVARLRADPGLLSDGGATSAREPKARRVT